MKFTFFVYILIPIFFRSWGNVSMKIKIIMNVFISNGALLCIIP